MDKETLSNYGWIVICTLVLAVMLALATPFGEYIKAGVWSTTNGLNDTLNKNMEIIGLNGGSGDSDFDTDEDMGSGSFRKEYIRGKQNKDVYVDNDLYLACGMEEGENPLDYFEPIVDAYFLELDQGTAQEGVTNGTGSVIYVYSDSSKTQKLATYTLVIYGDVDGDGCVDVIDAGRIDQHANNLNKIVGVANIRAADVDCDGEITSIDLTRVYYHAIYWRMMPANVSNKQDLFIAVPHTETDAFIDEDSGNYIYGVPEGANPNEYFVVSNGGTFEFKSGANNNVINGTGSIATVYKDANKTEIVSEYTYILFGDVTGDGKISSDDATAMTQHINGTKIITDKAFIFAGDLDYDDAITSEDLDILNKHLNGTELIPPDILH